MASPSSAVPVTPTSSEPLPPSPRLARVSAILTDPFRPHPEWAATLSVPQQEQRRRQALLRLTVISTNFIVLFVALPSMLLFHTPPLVVGSTVFSAVIGIPCLILNSQQRTTMASLIFLGVFFGGLVPNIVFRSPGGFDITSVESFGYLVLLLVIAGLVLPARLLFLTSAIIITTTIIVLIIVPFAPQILGPATDATQIRFATGGIFVTLEVFVTVLSWIVMKSSTAGLEGAQRAFDLEHELVALKDQFIVSANHELRTPVMALYGNVEFLATLGDRANSTQTKLLLQRALQAGDTLLGLLNTIFEASTTEPSRIRLTLTPIQVEPLIQTIIATFDPREIGEPTLAMDHYQTRTIHLHIPHDITIMADEKRMRQVLLNLLTNALKYSNPGTPIELRVEAVPGGEVQIAIRDWGLGVPPAEAERLFQRFVRLDRDVAGSVRGTGLGLYLCRSIIEAMGGKIWVESTGVPGEGSRFIFTVPQTSLPGIQPKIALPSLAYIASELPKQ